MRRRTWWIMLFVLPAVHFAVQFVLIYFRFTTYYDKPYPFESLLNVVVFPASWIDWMAPDGLGEIALFCANSVLWGVVLAVAIRAARGWRLVRRPTDASVCAWCGYDLRASAGGCPECGTPRPAAAGASSSSSAPR